MTMDLPQQPASAMFELSTNNIHTTAASLRQNPKSNRDGGVMTQQPQSNSTVTLASAASTQARRLYRKDGNKIVTRDIAALDFLLGIPLAAEEKIVQQGLALEQKQEWENRDEQKDDLEYMQHQVTAVPSSAKGKWWEKWVQEPRRVDVGAVPFSHVSPASNHGDLDEQELELPVPSERRIILDLQHGGNNNNKNLNSVISSFVPGRRLQGDDAVLVQIPLTTKTMTKQKTIARQAALREWELQTAHGLQRNNHQKHPPMLDGRLFFSAAGSYPMSVFSLIRYEPKKEEMKQRRQKLEALGGGGTHFVVPARDWRGISYRSLLPQKRNRQHSKGRFNRFLRSDPTSDNNLSQDENDDDETIASISSESSEDSNMYLPGLLDDPAMVLGRHRNVMIGDRVTGPIVFSTIQFVKPALLKAELNKQFRDRFDGWEPPRGARKYIGAKVVDGEYKLMDPTEDDYHESHSLASRTVTSAGSVSDGHSTIAPKEKQLHIPPSLTLSKIRSAKNQALAAAVKAKLEIGTVALSCVYFERLCLDCRVDKSNRRLAFAACLLLASKLNEPNVGLVMHSDEKTGANDTVANRLQSLVRPNRRSRNIFASLLEFFTEQWNLPLKNLFDAEWGVFAALGFSLHAKPSHVAFHFKRLMKTMGWNPRNYLGEEMYNHWQSALEMEEDRRREKLKRRERMRRRKEEHILNLRIEMENEVIRRKVEERGGKNNPDGDQETPTAANGVVVDKAKSPRMTGIRLLNRFGMRRVTSQEKMDATLATSTDHMALSEHLQNARTRLVSTTKGMGHSPSLPNFSGVRAIEIPHMGDDDASSIGSVGHSDKGIIV